MTRVRVAGLSVLVLALGAGPLRAQGTLSTQGLGYPPGQLSTKAVAMGGALGETDPLSPLNPAAIGLLTASIILMQAEPEYRQLTIGGTSQNTSVARFPLFLGAVPFGSRWVMMASASTLFDRTWSTTARESAVIGPDTVNATVTQLSDGSIADVRVAAAYAVNGWLRVGLAGHAFTGRDVLRTVRQFDDSVSFAQDTTSNTISFGGSAISVGVQTLWPKIAAVGLAYRRGGALRTYDDNELAVTSSAPDHFGLSVAYLGVNGATLAARIAKDSWTRSKDLSPTLVVHEGWDIGLGADVQGPTFGGGHIGLRTGARWRTLPFSTGATAVKERTFSGGFGIPLSPRAEVNLGVLRAARKGPAAATENAWTISTGFSVRP